MVSVLSVQFPPPAGTSKVVNCNEKPIRSIFAVAAWKIQVGRVEDPQKKNKRCQSGNLRGRATKGRHLERQVVADGSADVPDAETVGRVRRREVWREQSAPSGHYRAAAPRLKKTDHITP